MMKKKMSQAISRSIIIKNILMLTHPKYSGELYAQHFLSNGILSSLSKPSLIYMVLFGYECSLFLSISFLCSFFHVYLLLDYNVLNLFLFNFIEFFGLFTYSLWRRCWSMAIQFYCFHCWYSSHVCLCILRASSILALFQVLW